MSWARTYDLVWKLHVIFFCSSGEDVRKDEISKRPMWAMDSGVF